MARATEGGVVIERFPEGTDEIPFPHKVFHWKRGVPTLTIELPYTWALRKFPPKLAGWTPFFCSVFGHDKPMTYSYRPTREVTA